MTIYSAFKFAIDNAHYAAFCGVQAAAIEGYNYSRSLLHTTGRGPPEPLATAPPALISASR